MPSSARDRRAPRSWRDRPAGAPRRRRCRPAAPRRSSSSRRSSVPLLVSENDVRSLTQRAAQREAVVLLLLRAALRRERVPRVQRVVAEREVGRAAQRPGAGLVVMSTNTRPPPWFSAANDVAPEADRGSAISAAACRRGSRRRGSPRPARHLLQRGFHLVGIVRQRVDLIASRARLRSVAPRIERALAPVLADRHVFGMSRDRQPHLAPRLRRRAAAGRRSAAARSRETRRGPRIVRARGR